MQIIINRGVVLICAIAILNQPVFFSFMGLLGVKYEGSESSMVYVSYIVLMAGFSLLTYLYGVATKGLLRRESIFIITIFLLFALHALWVIFDPINTKLFPQFLVLFLLMGLPGYLAAATIIKLDLIAPLVRCCELLFIVMAIGIVTFSVIPTFAGSRTASLGGASYQALSYFSAFAFGMLLIYNACLPKFLRVTWVSTLWYKALSYGLMTGCILGCFLGGGRGAFLLLLSYFVIVTGSVFLNKSVLTTHNGIANALFRFLSIVAVVVVFFILFWEEDFVQSGFARATEFISSDGSIDLERGSSGRNKVYQGAISYISDSPVIGYGPFGFRDKTVHAHNIFLEVWLQLGIVGLIGFLMLMGLLVVSVIRNWTVYSFWAFGMFLYPLIMVMFSGAYLHTSVFCFAVAFLAMCRSKGLVGRVHSV